MIVLYGVLFLLPIYWETTQHETPAAAGLGLLTLPLNMMVSAPWAGRARDRYGSWRIVALLDPSLWVDGREMWRTPS